MRSKEQVLADIEATEQQQSMFVDRLDSLYDELEDAERFSDFGESAKELKKLQTAIKDAGFSESESFQLLLAIIVSAGRK